MTENYSFIGKILGHYRLEKIIGEGSMGSVYFATHQENNSPAALKILHPGYCVGSSGKRHLKRFQREGHYASLINHPNIVKVYETGEQDGVFYIAMEFIKGRSLLEIINNDGPLSVARALAVAQQTASALEAAHLKNIIHRDIKAGNILVMDNDQIKLADFGLARVLDGMSSISQPGQIIGTVFYMSPEQAIGDSKIDQRVDFYGLGITLFQGLTGRLPYTGRTPLQILQQHISAPIPSLKEYVPSIPPCVDAMVQKLMSKKPEQRFATASEVLQAIASCQTQLGIEPQQQPAWSKTPYMVLAQMWRWSKRFWQGNPTILKLRSSRPARWTALFGTIAMATMLLVLAAKPWLTGIRSTWSAQPPVKLSHKPLPESSQPVTANRVTQSPSPLLPAAFSTKIVRLEILPKEIWLRPRATAKLEIHGVDEANDTQPITVQWQVTGGSLEDGVYKAGEQHGDFIAIASDPKTALKAQVLIHIESPQETTPISFENGWFGERMPAGLKRGVQAGDYFWKKDASRMVYIPEGEFWMGDARGKADEKFMKKVFLSAFYIDKYELSQQQYQQFSEATGYPINPQPEWEVTPQHPAVHVSWEDAKEYARWAMKRLPTEAEWEKAAKGGFKIPQWSDDGALSLTLNPYPRRSYPWGDSLPYAKNTFFGNYVAYDKWPQRGEDGFIYTAPIGSFAQGKSPYQCLDMAGNVWEWCEDTYQANFYQHGPPIDPIQKEIVLSPERVLRGGSWFNFAESCRTSRRYHAHYNSRLPWAGIRLAK